MSVARAESGWAGTAMRWIARLTAPAEIGLAFAAGVLAGGVVLGLAPGTRAAVAMADAVLATDEDATPWRDAVAAWRSDFWASQRALVPWLGAIALVAVEAGMATAGLLPGGLATVLPLLVVAAYLVRCAVIVSILAAEGAALGAWRAALIVPAVRPVSSLVFGCVCAAVLLVGLAYPALGLIFGAGIVILAATWLGRADLSAVSERQAGS